MPLNGPCCFFLWRQWLAPCRLWRTTQVPHFKEAFFHCFRKLGRRGFLAAVKAGDAEKDILWLGVVAGPVAVRHHGTIAAKHLHGCGHLEERTGQKPLV